MSIVARQIYDFSSNWYTCTHYLYCRSSLLHLVDSMDGFSLQKHTPKISLLELMQFSGNVHSAESTARRLLQFIASQYSGVETTEDLTSTQNVSYSLRVSGV